MTKRYRQPTRTKKIKTKKIKCGEKFERIVAAIHAAQSKGAEVRWNEDIEGRQFDVVVKFKFGFYEHLNLIECKDHKRPVEAEEVDAFVTKTTDAHADKAIMVSASGFQKKAQQVARKHGVRLYTLRYVQEMPEELLTQEIVSVLIIHPIGFRKPPSDNLVVLVPPDPAADFILVSHERDTLKQQLNESILSNFGGATIGELVRIFAQLLTPHNVPGVPETTFPKATDKPQYQQFQLPIGTTVTMPGYPEPIPVTHFLFAYWMGTDTVIKLLATDPTTLTDFGSRFDYKDVIANESILIDPKTLPPAFETVFRAGTFYEQPALQLRYYCEAVDDSNAKICLIESYNQGTLCRARLTLPLSNSGHYLEITKAAQIDRLRTIYNESFAKFI